MGELQKYDGNKFELVSAMAKKAGLNLNMQQSMILRAKSKTAISEIDSAEAMGILQKDAEFIMRDLGIVYNPNTDNYSTVRFADVVLRYYSQLTIAEVKLAFEMLIQGKLDSELPHDSKGVAEKKHYQQFSFDFAAKVLDAYVKVSSKSISGLNKQLSVAAPSVVTDEVKKSLINEFLQDLVDAFNTYKKTGFLPPYKYNGFVYEKLVEAKLCEELDEASYDYTEALTDVLSTTFTPFNYGRIKEQGKSNVQVETKARMKAIKVSMNNMMDDCSMEEIETKLMKLWIE